MLAFLNFVHFFSLIVTRNGRVPPNFEDEQIIGQYDKMILCYQGLVIEVSILSKSDTLISIFESGKFE